QRKNQERKQMVRAGVELLAHDIEAGHPEVLAECLKAMARFRWFSFGNILLISSQHPPSHLSQMGRQLAGLSSAIEHGRRLPGARVSRPGGKIFERRSRRSSRALLAI